MWVTHKTRDWDNNLSKTLCTNQGKQLCPKVNVSVVVILMPLLVNQTLFSLFLVLGLISSITRVKHKTNRLKQAYLPKMKFSSREKCISSYFLPLVCVIDFPLCFHFSLLQDHAFFTRLAPYSKKKKKILFCNSGQYVWES